MKTLTAFVLTVFVLLLTNTLPDYAYCDSGFRGGGSGGAYRGDGYRGGSGGGTYHGGRSRGGSGSGNYHGDGSHGGGSHHHGGHSHGGDSHHHGGHWHGSVWLGPGSGWFFWAPWWGVPYYPYYAYPPVVVEPQPLLNIETEPEHQEQGYWYYCKNPEGYYPYVQQCPGGWMKVVPSPVPPGVKE